MATGAELDGQSEGGKNSAEPHPKDGHIRLPNDIVENLARLKANGSQYRIIFAIWRRTLGWQKSGEWKNEPYPISLGDLVKMDSWNKTVFYTRIYHASIDRWEGKATSNVQVHNTCSCRSEVEKLL